MLILAWQLYLRLFIYNIIERDILEFMWRIKGITISIESILIYVRNDIYINNCYLRVQSYKLHEISLFEINFLNLLKKKSSLVFIWVCYSQTIKGQQTTSILLQFTKCVICRLHHIPEYSIQILQLSARYKSIV